MAAQGVGMSASLKAGKTSSVLCIGVAAVLFAAPAFARSDDAVDSAIARARDAVATKDWAAAAKAYEQARSLLPGGSPELSLELGTVYGHLGQYGEAALFLNDVLSRHATRDVEEAARTNLGVVRRQIEAQANDRGLRISRTLGAIDVLAGLLATTSSATLAIGAGAAAGIAWLVAALRSKLSVRIKRLLQMSALVLAGTWFILGLAHGLARSYEGEGRAVVVANPGAFYEGPGTHRPRLFGVVPGSQVVVLEKGSAWYRVRLVGGPEGWIAREQVSEFID
jgi:hypothetical protein